MKFNPNDYETVKSRKKRFYEDYPDGRIIVEMINSDEVFNSALFKAYIYFNAEDHKAGIPRSTGYAYEVRDTELKVSKSGGMYESVNYSSWTENAEESAVGRALDNAGYSGNLKCSREEMEKAQRMNETMKTKNVSPEEYEAEKKKKTLGNAYKKISEMFGKLHYSSSQIEKFLNGYGLKSLSESKDVEQLRGIYKTLETLYIKQESA